MAVPRARAGSGAGQRGDTAITVRKDLVMDEGTGLVAERKTVVAGVPTADSESGGGVATEEQLRPMRPYAAFRRTAGYHPVILEDEEEEEHSKPRRSFCRSWCEMWFLVAQSRISCTIFTISLFVAGIALILITSLGGIVDCPPLMGATVFCFLVAILAISLACLCCCYHWVRDDEDLPFAIFCTAYCLLLLFLFTVVAGSTAVYTHIDVITDSNYTYTGHDGKPISCAMTELPMVVMGLSYFVGVLFLLMATIAFILAMGATT